MMEWILIVIVTNSKAIDFGTKEFHTLESCTTTAEMIVDLNDADYRNRFYAICTANPEKELDDGEN